MDYPQISLKPEDLQGKISFAQVFGRSAPVHIEVGSGRATFLINQAKTSPEIDFLGIEWANRFYRYAVDRIGRWNLKNVRLLRTDAAVFVAESVPDESVDCFHIYFPDPWPKKHHNKRRFIKEANLLQLIRCLKSEGQIRLATDHADYFEQMKRVISGCSGILKEIDFYPAAGADKGEWVGSNFERKYLKQQRPIYTLAVIKILNANS